MENKKMIFVVDDDEGVREALGRILKRDYQISCFSDGAEAWKEISENHLPHLLITDWEMPNLNGLELISLVKSKFPIPVIMMSARSRPEGCPADAFLEKPYNCFSLRETIKRLIDKQPF